SVLLAPRRTERVFALRTDGPATTDAALAALAAEAGLIDPDSPDESSAQAENELFSAKINGHAENDKDSVLTDDVGGTSTEGQGSSQGNNQGNAENPPENTGNENNGEASAGNGGFGSFPDTEYLSQENEEEDDEDEEMAPIEDETSEDVTENISQNLLDLPLPFGQTTVDGQVGEMESQVMVVQPTTTSTQSEETQNASGLKPFSGANFNSAQSSTNTASAEGESAQASGASIEDTIALKNPEDSNKKNGTTTAVGIEEMDTSGNGSEDQNVQVTAANHALGTLPTATVQGEILGTATEQEPEVKQEKLDEADTKNAAQPDVKVEVPVIKTEQLDDLETDSDALATLASAALGCDQAPTNGIKNETSFMELESSSCLMQIEDEESSSIATNNITGFKQNKFEGGKRNAIDNVVHSARKMTLKHS
ncbi:hypothetical protein L9F63_018242, partial [Diploptera punctata]